MHEIEQRINQSPAYKRLVTERRRMSVTGVSLIIAMYLGFDFLSVYAPELMARPVWSDAVLSLGIALALVIGMSIVAIAAVYVHRANSLFERLEKSLLEELEQ